MLTVLKRNNQMVETITQFTTRIMGKGCALDLAFCNKEKCRIKNNYKGLDSAGVKPSLVTAAARHGFPVSACGRLVVRMVTSPLLSQIGIGIQ